MEPTRNEKTPGALHLIRGIPFSLAFKKETIEEALDYMPHDGDIIVTTYPKAGSTWLQYIVHQIVTKGEELPDFNDMIEKVVPVPETAGVAAVEALKTKPRIYKHHLPYNMVKKNPNSKVIYIYRKPEDLFVSYYHFLCSVLGHLDFEQSFEGFITGNVSFGSYFKNLLSFLEHKDDPNLLLVSYEKLKLNTREEILRIAKFIGQEYYDAIVGDKSILNKIMEHTSFDYMKKNLTFTMPKDPEKDSFSRDVPQKEIHFFRKGVIGDGKNSLSNDKLKKIREVAEEVLKGTPVLKEWYGN